MELPYLVHRKLRLYQTPELFYLIPVDQTQLNQALSINRINNEIDLMTDSNEMEAIERSVFHEIIFGIFGMIKLVSGYYLIVITGASPVGEIFSPGGIVYKIDNVKIIPFKSDLLPSHKRPSLTDQQIEFNRRYLQMIEYILRMPNYYFSYVYDLSSTLQRTMKLQPKTRTLIQATNLDFVWNRSLISLLMANQTFHYFCLPIMCGFVAIQQEMINHRQFRWVLLSRRSTHRCGTRWFARGINSEGWVANFIETEQMLITDQDERFSLVQIRGSIPLFWSQLPNLRYKPPFIIPKAPHIESYGHHVRRLSREYGRLCFVNLISTRGSEGKLHHSFSEVVNDGNFNRGNDIPFVNFESFDFHHECRKGWQSLSKLMDQIAPFIKEYGYFWWNKQKGIQRLQQGVIRTNCIDSLDRTNVVQSLIAKQVLQSQMIQAGLITQFENIEDYPNLNFIFSNMWADNADVCSIQYAGTGALKSDFTRTGKRRLTGIIADGINSLIRYYKNNFEDGFRQDCIDLILGAYQVDEREGKQIKCPLEKRNVWKIFFLPSLFLLSTFMIIVTLGFGSVHAELEQALVALFWFAMLSICFIIMFYLGNEFADYPTLVRRR